MEIFRLSETFLDTYKNQKPKWGYDGLGETTFYRTYSRLKEDGTKEAWWETVRRVVEGTYSIQKDHIKKQHKKWIETKAQNSAQRMFHLIFNFKFTPPGRGLWAMGSPIITERNLFAALNNCAFVSTDKILEDPIKPFEFLMDMSMLGVGVGFDVDGADLAPIYTPTDEVVTYKITDDRQGWVKSLTLALSSYLLPGYPRFKFDYSDIRPAGTPIKGFGGIASGPDCLQLLHERIVEIFEGTPYDKAQGFVDQLNEIKSKLNGHTKDDKMWNKIQYETLFHVKIVINENGYAYLKKTDIPTKLSRRQIVDLQNVIGVCVVSGNVRRSAEIALGDNGNEFVGLKDYVENKERANIGWTSNNSVKVLVGDSYQTISESILQRGEPGVLWMDNVRDYGRTGDKKDYKDHRAKGTNPCSEQTLESFELCCLVETYLNNIESIEEFKEVLKYSYMYAKTVTLGHTHWEETNEVMSRNRRIGNSLTGVVQFIEKFGVAEYVKFLKEGYDTIQYYDKVYSEWFAIPRSIKTTSIKPSGTVSLLAGSTPGVHWPNSKGYYFRTIRIGSDDPVMPILRDAGYRIEKDVVDVSGKTEVVYFPIKGECSRDEKEVSIWEKYKLVDITQRFWADNQVSVTLTYNPETESQHIHKILEYGQFSLKSLSFLPISNFTYEQMPYQSISEEEYLSNKSNLRPLDFGKLQATADVAAEKYCSNDTCTI